MFTDNRGKYTVLMGAFDPRICSRGEAIYFTQVKSPTLARGVVATWDNTLIGALLQLPSFVN